MKVLNYGSASIDFVFAVDHISAPGETISSKSRELFPGGKGLNQSIALARAGAEVYHAGAIGHDGDMLLRAMQDAGVRLDFLRRDEGPTGNALIQVDAQGQNSILLFAGVNRSQTREEIAQVLSRFGPGDMLLLQNEINLVDVLVSEGYARGLTVALNPSPFDSALDACDLSKVGIFLLNEVEGAQLTGETEAEEILRTLGKRFPAARVVLTLGEKGARYAGPEGSFRQPAFPVRAVDTTAAGDTFTGFFLAAIARALSVPEALRIAAQASALSVCRKGASSSIPRWEEAQAALQLTL